MTQDTSNPWPVVDAFACCLRLACSLSLSTSVFGLRRRPAEETQERRDIQSESFKAPVIVDGDTLFRLRGSSALPAPERAETVQDNIIEGRRSSESPDVEYHFRGNRAWNPDPCRWQRRFHRNRGGCSELDQMELDVLSLSARRRH